MKSCKSDLNPGQNISGIYVAGGGLETPLGSALGGLIDPHSRGLSLVKASLWLRVAPS